MRVTTVTYSRTVQPKPFESARLEMTAEVESSDSPEDVARFLREVVHAELGLLPKPSRPAPTAEPPPGVNDASIEVHDDELPF